MIENLPTQEEIPIEICPLVKSILNNDEGCEQHLTRFQVFIRNFNPYVAKV